MKAVSFEEKLSSVVKEDTRDVTRHFRLNLGGQLVPKRPVSLYLYAYIALMISFALSSHFHYFVASELFLFLFPCANLYLCSFARQRSLSSFSLHFLGHGYVKPRFKHYLCMALHRSAWQMH